MAAKMAVHYVHYIYLTFAPLAGEGVVVVSRGFVPTHHTQLILPPDPGPGAQPGPLHEGVPSQHGPSLGGHDLQVWVTAEVGPRGAAGVGGAAGLRGRGPVDRELDVVDRVVLLLAERKGLELRLLERVSQRIHEDICRGWGRTRWNRTEQNGDVKASRTPSRGRQMLSINSHAPLESDCISGMLILVRSPLRDSCRI